MLPLPQLLLPLGDSFLFRLFLLFYLHLEFFFFLFLRNLRVSMWVVMVADDSKSRGVTGPRRLVPVATDLRAETAIAMNMEAIIFIAV